MSRLAIHLFGSPRLELNETPVHIPRRKAMATLAYLAVTGQRYSRETLAALFWPENDHSSARAELRRTLSVLNRILGEGWLVTDRETVSLNIQDDPTRGSIFWLDVNEFQQQIQACETHDHPPTEACQDCITHLLDVVALYTDDFMAGFNLPDSPAFDEWQFFQAEDLRRKFGSVLECLSTYYSTISEYESAITHARRWLALDPLHEPAHQQLMVLYAQSGQQAAALRQYETCHQLLVQELGVDPSKETQALVERIRRGEGIQVSGSVAVQKWKIPYSTVRTNLPVQTVPFVGRETEMADLGKLLGDPKVHLVTILGPGGIGKTRLAQEVGAAQLDNYEQGVYFVPLEPLESVDRIVPTVAEAVSFSFYSGEEPRKQLLDFMRKKNMLLLMDNYEHLLSGVDIINEIFKIAPGVKILATSRERLNLSGEYRYPLDGLELPGEQTLEAVLKYSAVRLFLESAKRALPNFEINEDNIGSVVKICHLVGGMPLAIRLAAVWVEMLSPREIAQEIKRGLDFLTADWRDMPERQRSIQAVFDHSWRLLSQEEREVFQGLSVFRGGFTREGAKEVTGASLHTLMALVNKSLISRDTAGRYEMHELCRQYAAGKLASDPEREIDVRDRHCVWYTEALQRWEVDRKGPRQVETLTKLVKEVDNIRAAWDWAVTREILECLDLAINGLGWFFFRQSLFSEIANCCHRAEQVLRGVSPQVLDDVGSVFDSTQHPGNKERILAKILLWHGAAIGYISEQGAKLLEESLKILECLEEIRGPDHNPVWNVREEKAFSLTVLGVIIFNTSGAKMAKRFLEQSIELYREIGDHWGLAYALSNFAWSISGSLLKEAEKLYEESLGIFRMLEDGWGIAKCLGELMTLALMQGQHVKMKRFIEESLVIRKELGDQYGLGADIQGIGVTDVHLGNFVRGLTYLNESLAISNDLGHPPFLFAHSKMYLCEANAHLGQYAEANICGQTALTIFHEMSYQLGVGLCCYMLGLTALGEGKYGEAQQVLQESAAIFKEIDNRESLGYALAISGYAARRLNDRSQAFKYLHEAVKIAADLEVFIPFIYSLPLVALLFADHGEVERAVELYALATCYGFVVNSNWFDDMAGRELTALSATLPSSVVTAAQTRGRELNWQETARKLLEELNETSWVDSE